MLTKWGISDEGSSFCTPPRVRRRSEISEFEFKKHCFFCGEICKPKDSKNPTRWRKVVQVKTVGAPGKVPLKDAILQKCEERNDEVSQVVHVRLSSISDLHAADAQYHKDCFQKFFSVRNIKAFSIPKEQNPNEKLQKLVDMINAQPKNLWSTTKLFEEYTNICDNSDETKKERRQVISDLKDYYGEDLVEMKIEGCASLFSLRNHLAEKLKPEEPRDNEDNLEEIVKQIKFETKNIMKQNTYNNIQ